MCLYYTPTSVLLAWGLTGSIFFILTIYVFVTKDFNFLGAGLSVYDINNWRLISYIWLPNDKFLNTALAILGAMVACGYILYDTSDIMKRLEPEDFVYACMSIYLDIILLFYKILELWGNKK